MKDYVDEQSVNTVHIENKNKIVNVTVHKEKKKVIFLWHDSIWSQGEMSQNDLYVTQKEIQELHSDIALW